MFKSHLVPEKRAHGRKTVRLEPIVLLFSCLPLKSLSESQEHTRFGSFVWILLQLSGGGAPQVRIPPPRLFSGSALSRLLQNSGKAGSLLSRWLYVKHPQHSDVATRCVLMSIFGYGNPTATGKGIAQVVQFKQTSWSSLDTFRTSFSRAFADISQLATFESVHAALLGCSYRLTSQTHHAANSLVRL